jgi:DNA-binding beta-propeller fold protein YncE
MLKRLVGILLVVFSIGGVFAQDTPPLGPIGSLEAGDFRALAVTVDGDRLLVADAENRQVRVYDFSTPSQPTLLTTLGMSGTPVLLAGGENFALVAVTTDDDSDRLEAVAPALPGQRAQYVSGWGNIDIGKNPRALALSPDSRWGIAVSESNYTLLQINGVGEIGAIPVDEIVLDAALSNSTVYLLREGSLETAPLDNLAAIQAEQTLELEGVPTMLTLSADNDAGVVVLDGTHLVFFDPATLETTGEFTLEGQPISSVHFLSNDGTQYLVVTQQDSSSFAVLSAADPQNVALLPSIQSLGRPVTALTVFGQFVIATDGVTIRIFST